MPKVSELVKLLKKDGWYVYRHGSSHDLYRHRTKKGQLTIPRHGAKELARGTYYSILKAAGLK
ncbi:MAG: type II toxin-antitoxin system HicA family toxin [Schleiferiaceae bacterium]